MGLYPHATVPDEAMKELKADQEWKIPLDKTIWTADYTFSTNSINRFRSHMFQVHKTWTKLNGANIPEQLATPRLMVLAYDRGNTSATAYNQLSNWANTIYSSTSTKAQAFPEALINCLIANEMEWETTGNQLIATIPETPANKKNIAN